MVKRIIGIFTMLILAISILCVSDIISKQCILSELESVATTVGYYISKNGGITEQIKVYVKKEINAEIKCAMDGCESVKKGDTYFYILERKYTPIIIQQGESKVSIKRSIVIGIYS